MTEHRDIIEALLNQATPVLQREFKPDVCILGTRMAIECLDAFGVRARPQPVGMMVFNAEARALAEGGMPVEELQEVMRRIPKEQPGGPWVIGVDPNDDPRDGRFNGHLVAIAGSVLVDLTLPQVNRPHKGIKLDPTAITLGPLWDEEGHDGDITDDGVMVIWEKADHNLNWQLAPDWTWPALGTDGRPRRALNRALTGEIIRAMRRELNR